MRGLDSSEAHCHRIEALEGNHDGVPVGELPFVEVPKFGGMLTTVSPSVSFHSSKCPNSAVCWASTVTLTVFRRLAPGFASATARITSSELSFLSVRMKPDPIDFLDVAMTGRLPPWLE